MKNNHHLKQHIKEFLFEVHLKFQNFIFYLTSDLGWVWIDAFIDGLAYIEMNLCLLKHTEFRNNLYVGDVCAGNNSWIEQQIPKGSPYCNNCPFYRKSKIAWFFYGHQSCGFCYMLNRGDFTFGYPTNLLWDGNKECGLYMGDDNE